MFTVSAPALPIQCTSERPYDIAAPGALVSRQTFVFLVRMRKRSDERYDWTQPGWCEWDHLELRVLMPAAAIGGRVREILQGLTESLGWEYLDWFFEPQGDLEF